MILALFVFYSDSLVDPPKTARSKRTRSAACTQSADMSVTNIVPEPTRTYRIFSASGGWSLHFNKLRG